MVIIKFCIRVNFDGEDPNFMPKIPLANLQLRVVTGQLNLWGKSRIFDVGNFMSIMKDIEKQLDDKSATNVAQFRKEVYEWIDERKKIRNLISLFLRLWRKVCK